MTIVQVKLCQLATKVKNWRILLEQRYTAHMLLVTAISALGKVEDDKIEDATVLFNGLACIVYL